MEKFDSILNFIKLADGSKKQSPSSKKKPPSPERAIYTNDGQSPSLEKKQNPPSPERAKYILFIFELNDIAYDGRPFYNAIPLELIVIILKSKIIFVD